jgi:CubicO group peptidase (beta-lactamase class C family)
MIRVQGYVDPKYSQIADAFADNFNHHGEVGASLTVYHHHQLVVNVWAGHKDLRKKMKWDNNTVVPIFSTTKAISACCMAICHSKGLFDYEDKVVKYWPDFAANGKENITIAQLLQHRAGLPAIDQKLTVEIIQDRALLESIIAKQKPHWTPGEYQGYHPWNIGWFISALLSKIDPKGRRLKEFLEEEVLPYIDGDVRIGVNDDYQWENVAKLIPFSRLKIFSLPFVFVKEFCKPWSLTFRSLLNPAFAVNHINFNKKEILKLEIGGGGGLGNSNGLASLFDGLTNPNHPLYLKPNTLDYLYDYPAPPTYGYQDFILKLDAFRFHGGFMKPSEKHNFSTSKKSFGGFGAGGSFAISDPENNLTCAYTMNKMGHELMNMKREVNIRNEVYRTIVQIE